ncbi:MAG: 5'-methylthioadenosine/S-adenosylhomocysteine nucleosidase [Sedimentisphaeraceae bacterium JB056]
MVDTDKNILVVAAIKGELKAFIEPLNAEEAKLGPFTYYTDELAGGNKVYCVLCGAGKVNSASITSAFIAQKDFNIGLVINTGTAGSLDKSVKKGDIVVGVDYYQHDYDITGLFSDFKIGQMMGKDNILDVVPADIIDKMPRQDNVHFGTIISGDRFIDAGVEFQHGRPLAVDMESAAISHMCYHFYKIPFVSIRAITDGADGDAHEDWITTHERLSYAAAEYSMKAITELYQSNFK